MITIAVDMMGSDLGPEELSKGVIKYLDANNDVSFICFGDPERLKALDNNPRVKIVKTTEVVPMETSPLGFLRLKDSSMYKALEAVQTNQAQGLVTAGSTGGFITGATLILKNIPGVKRAGFCSYFPSKVKDKSVAILDLGASNINTPEELVGFAKLGSLYYQESMGKKDPSVYLLSNGTEEGKGLEECRQAYQLLKNEKDVNFKGNAEARDALDGTKDVIVSPGYPGNIFLKASEGMALTFSSLIKQAFKRNLLSKIGYLFAKKGFTYIHDLFDYKKTGGAMLLGINGVAVKTHGNSTGDFLYYSLDLAYRMVKTDFVGKVKSQFKE